jgi:hypothetical protein
MAGESQQLQNMVIWRDNFTTPFVAFRQRHELQHSHQAATLLTQICSWLGQKHPRVGRPPAVHSHVRRWFTDLDRTTVIDECRAKRKPDSSSAVLMFFFQSQDDTAVSLFESLTKQLIATMIGTSTPCSPEILSTLEKAYGNEVSRPEVSQVITDLVLPLCSHLPQITLVIDGVDECRQTELRLIWEGLDRILKNVHAKVLISSEDQTNLHLKGFDRIRIDQQHNKADIDTYVDEQIAGLSGPDQLFGDKDSRKNIKIKLQEKADGMFVLAQPEHATTY